MNKGDRVSMSPMWKYDKAIGVVKKITKDGYYVILWDGINGEWYFTEEQIKGMEVIHESG